MSLLIQNCPKHSFTLCLPLIFPFARPPPETAVLHHLIWFYTHRPNIAADMNRNEKYSTVFPQTPRVHSPQLFGHAVHWCEWTFITLYVQCSAWCFFFVCFFQDCRTKNRKKNPFTLTVPQGCQCRCLARNTQEGNCMKVSPPANYWWWWTSHIENIVRYSIR